MLLNEIEMLKDEDLGNVVSARKLHGYLEVGRDFTTWIKGRINKYEFEENIDYKVIKFDSPNLVNQNKRGGDRKSVDYIITLDVAKELSMIENNNKGREARRYFIDCEKYILESNQSPEFEYFRKTGKILRKDLTATIKNIMTPSNKFVYSNFTNLVYLKGG